MSENTTTSAEIPHFSLPLRYLGGKPAVNEQDGWDDVYDSVQLIARLDKGDLDHAPDLGKTPLEFTTTSDSEEARSGLEEEISEWEPRTTLHTEWADALMDMAANVVTGVEEPSA